MRRALRVPSRAVTGLAAWLAVAACSSGSGGGVDSGKDSDAGGAEAAADSAASSSSGGGSGGGSSGGDGSSEGSAGATDAGDLPSCPDTGNVIQINGLTADPITVTNPPTFVAVATVQATSVTGYDSANLRTVGAEISINGGPSIVPGQVTPIGTGTGQARVQLGDEAQTGVTICVSGSGTAVVTILNIDPSTHAPIETSGSWAVSGCTGDNAPAGTVTGCFHFKASAGDGGTGM